MISTQQDTHSGGSLHEDRESTGSTGEEISGPEITESGPRAEIERAGQVWERE